MRPRSRCTYSSLAVPIRRTVDGLVDAWLSEHPREDYELVVAHTHGHHDHRGGDPQFADRPRTAIVGHTAEEVRSFYGFSDWPGQVVRFDLGAGFSRSPLPRDTTRPP
jgi:hydroxyacylglutathione hydrolase